MLNNTQIALADATADMMRAYAVATARTANHAIALWAA